MQEKFLGIIKINSVGLCAFSGDFSKSDRIYEIDWLETGRMTVSWGEIRLR